jgi:hypothetical protein
MIAIVALSIVPFVVYSDFNNKTYLERYGNDQQSRLKLWMVTSLTSGVEVVIVLLALMSVSQVVVTAIDTGSKEVFGSICILSTTSILLMVYATVNIIVHNKTSIGH